MALSVQPVVFKPIEQIQAIKSPRTDPKIDKTKRKRAKPSRGQGAFVDIDV